jgi:Icc-related predicted phosphoesterase
MILSCGDLAPQYLSFLATYLRGPVFYVHGNHDACYEKTPPEGCICIDDRVVEYKGVRILGLGGSMCYNYGPHQYTEKQMNVRYQKQRPKIWLKGGIDILLTHAPAYHLNDGSDLPHRGFKCFTTIMDRYSPKLFLHGHVHMNYGRDFHRESEYKDTKIINAYERHIVEI